MTDHTDHEWRERHEQQAARIAEMEAAQAWRPIETAPKDGTEILAHCPHDQIHAGEPHIIIVRYNSNRHATGWYDQSLDGDGRRVDRPTHWMPLPPAPQEGE